MRVLLINVTCKKGSTGKIAYDLYSELNKNGHTAAICYGRGEVINEPGIHKISSNLEMYVHAALTRITGLTGYFSPFATRRLIRFIEEFKPDVVHLHELKTYYINICSVIEYLKKHNIKTVWTLHSEFLYTGKCGHSFDCSRWMDKCGKCPELRAYPKSLFFDFTGKMQRDKKRALEGFENLTIVTPSMWLAERAKKSFLKDRPIRVINNGIDNEGIFHPTEYKEILLKYGLRGMKIVLAVAPKLMSELKGGQWVLALAERFINEPVKFVLIGVDEASAISAKNVLALGRTENQKELAAFYTMADLFLICSKRENFPTTCLESLSCGTPVMGFDAGGTAETAPEGYGLFVPYGDLDKLEAGIRQFFCGKTNIKSKIECGAYARSMYDKRVMYDRYVKHGDGSLVSLRKVKQEIRPRVSLIFMIKGDLERNVPIITQITLALDNNYRVSVICTACAQVLRDLLEGKGARIYESNHKSFGISVAKKATDWLGVRNHFNRILSNIYNDGDILYIGSLDTALAIGAGLLRYKYILHIRELYDTFPLYIKMIKPYAKAAAAVVVPEFCRASVLKCWLDLDKLPVILPNKPYEHPRKRFTTIYNEENRKMIEGMADKKIILYQGHISRDRCIGDMIEVIAKCVNDEYALVLMGKSHDNYIDELKHNYPNIYHIDYVPAPFHLQITSYAYIGLVTYDDACLNNLFCAPNKIYEYSGYGIPMIGRDIPGLRYTIGIGNAGVCVDFNDAEAVCSALKEIESNYDLYSANAELFYDSTNVSEVFQTMMDRVNMQHEKVKHA